MRIKYIQAFIITVMGILTVLSSAAQKKSISQKVDSVCKLMTLEEKNGQMNQYNDDWNAKGPLTLDNDNAGQIQLCLGACVHVPFISIVGFGI